MFTDEQKEALSAKLERVAVKERSQAGRTFSYIEGWHAIAECNRIFGFDGWSRETLDMRCVWEGARNDKQAAYYTAKVRVTVTAGGVTIVREGTGSGSGFDRDLGAAHESAIKEAETDAMKRALMTFGNPFGLALYDKAQTEVEDAGGTQQRRQPPPPPPPQRPGPRSVERGTPIADARREIDAGTASTVPQNKPAAGRMPMDLKAWAASADALDFLRGARADLGLVVTGADMGRWMQDFRWQHDAIIEFGEARGKDGRTRAEYLNDLIGEAQDRCRANALPADGLRGAA